MGKGNAFDGNLILEELEKTLGDIIKILKHIIASGKELVLYEVLNVLKLYKVSDYNLLHIVKEAIKIIQEDRDEDLKTLVLYEDEKDFLRCKARANRYNIEQLTEKCVRYALIKSIIEASNMITDKNTTTDDVINNLLTAVARINFEQDRVIIDAQTGVIEALKELANIEEKSAGTTGFHSLDKFLNGGFKRGNLYIIAARPSQGKTTLGLSMAIANAKQDNGVLFFSLEMSMAQVIYKLISLISNVSTAKFINNSLSDEDIDKIEKAVNQHKDMLNNLFISDTSFLSVYDLETIIKMFLTSNESLSTVFIDYLQLMKPAKRGTREQEIAFISRTLKQLAKKYNIAIIALAQLNRDVDRRSVPRPQLSDIRESGAVEQDADVVMGLWRPSFYEISNIDDKVVSEKDAEVIIMKNREGATGSIWLTYNKSIPEFFENEYNSFSDMLSGKVPYYTRQGEHNTSHQEPTLPDIVDWDNTNGDNVQEQFSNHYPNQHHPNQHLYDDFLSDVNDSDFEDTNIDDSDIPF